VRLRQAVAVSAALALTLLAGCSDDPEPRPAPEPTSGSPTASPSETETPTESPTETTDPSPDETETADDPAALLDWRPVPGPVTDQVTVSGRWTLTLTEDGDEARLEGPRPQTYDAPRGYRFTDALIDGEYAAVVAEHQRASRPNVVSVVELDTGDTMEADVPTGVGGSWALGSGLLVGTASRGREYCLGVLDLLSDRSGPAACVPPRHGISNVSITPGGIAAMTFDDSRPSCRTLNRVDGSRFRPIGGVAECTGWDVAVTETSTVWSEIPDEKRIEVAELFTDTGAGPVELGPGTSGTLTWCGDAAYFVRDPQRSSDPARLVRVQDGEAEVVYESPGRGRAFLSAPRCGGTDLTVSAFTAAGDEQVTASLR
jgi:hypothetical protein